MENIEKLLKSAYAFGILVLCLTAGYITIEHKWDLTHAVVIGGSFLAALVTILVTEVKNRRMEQELAASRLASEEASRRHELTRKLAHSIAMIRTTPSLTQLEDVNQGLMEAMSHLAGSDKAAKFWVERETEALNKAREQTARDKGAN